MSLISQKLFIQVILHLCVPMFYGLNRQAHFLSLCKIRPNLKVLDMGPLRSDKGDTKVTLQDLSIYLPM